MKLKPLVLLIRLFEFENVGAIEYIIAVPSLMGYQTTLRDPAHGGMMYIQDLTGFSGIEFILVHVLRNIMNLAQGQAAIVIVRNAISLNVRMFAHRETDIKSN